MFFRNNHARELRLTRFLYATLVPMKDSTKQKVVVIVGQTASGKSALAINLAQRFLGEIISADSRQVYRGLDIGSGKVTPAEMGGIPHHLIDIREVTSTPYTAADFKKDASRTLNDIATRGNLPIVAGGTFFYIDMLLGKVASADVPPNQELRALLEVKSKEELFAELEAKDERRAATIDKDNKVRLVRALEIIDTLGLVPKQDTQLQYDTYTIGISIPKEELHEKIHTRLYTRMENGMLEEVEGLLKNGVPPERLITLGLEYRYITEFLTGVLTKEEMLEALEFEIRHFAKRQMTWLKRDEHINWFSSDKLEQIHKGVAKFLEQ